MVSRKRPISPSRTGPQAACPGRTHCTIPFFHHSTIPSFHHFPIPPFHSSIVAFFRYSIPAPLAGRQLRETKPIRRGPACETKPILRGEIASALRFSQ